jgi:transposase-like protein
MSKMGRPSSPEFKEEIILLVQSCVEYPVSKIARDPDGSAETLHKWVNQADIDIGTSPTAVTGRRRCIDYESRSRKIHRIALRRNASDLREAENSPQDGRYVFGGSLDIYEMSSNNWLSRKI